MLTAQRQMQTLSPELDYRVEQLLIQWWDYDSAYRGTPRGSHAAAFYGGGELGNIYQSAGDMLEQDVNHSLIDAVRGAVESLDRDHREAVEVSMLRITTVAVWRSNRLGTQLETLYCEAKVMLLPLLRRRRVEI
jgi:hypothetical protein